MAAARKAPLTRSEMMARVRAKDTGPEMAVRRALWAAGLRYRLHDKRLPGRPDIVLPARRIVVLVHGCFWHAHDGRPSYTGEPLKGHAGIRGATPAGADVSISLTGRGG